MGETYREYEDIRTADDFLTIQNRGAPKMEWQRAMGSNYNEANACHIRSTRSKDGNQGGGDEWKNEMAERSRHYIIDQDRRGRTARKQR